MKVLTRYHVTQDNSCVQKQNKETTITRRWRPQRVYYYKTGHYFAIFLGKPSGSKWYPYKQMLPVTLSCLQPHTKVLWRVDKYWKWKRSRLVSGNSTETNGLQGYLTWEKVNIDIVAAAIGFSHSLAWSIIHELTEYTLF